MNDKDLEAFEKWRNSTSTRLDIHDAWQTACEYKQKEYSNLMDAMTQTSQYNFKLQAENKKLRKALEFYADATNNPKQYMRQGYLVYNLKKAIFVDGGTIAREALKEVGGE
jgi:regulator of replication initiation timing